MNVNTGELTLLSEDQQAFREKILAGFQPLPDKLNPFAEKYMLEHADQPVDLEGDSELANYARKQRVKGAFGKRKNRPA